MKKGYKIKRVLVTALLGLLAFGAIETPAEAQVGLVPYSVYATTGTSQTALTNYAIIGAYTSVPNGAPVVTYLNASSPSSATTVRFWSCTNSTQAAAATTNVRTNQVGNTNGFSAGTTCVIRHLASDTYERINLIAPQLTNQIVFASDPVAALAIGDIIYQETLGGTIAVQTNNAANNWGVNLIGSGIYCGQPNKPLLIDTVNAVGTNAVINAVAARYQ